ncbi:MAG: hypothetical protein H5T91_02255 [Synergistetes bacterium]|nr:hypothetical protein [Synergistota bacterium]MDK2871541.1 hypothetical protein [bacterium]
MLSLGVFGTAKNTGKTTVFNTALRCLWGFGRVAITSIGFDGEDLDHITGLPKPKVVVDEGIWIVTSKGVTWRATARLELVRGLDVDTPFGSLEIYKAKSPGRVPLVGPNRADDLLKVKEILAGYGVELFLVDGAINRMIPFQYVDLVILATGASRSTNIEELLLETEAIVKALFLPKGEIGKLELLEGPISFEVLKSYEGRGILVESPFHVLLLIDYRNLLDLLRKVEVFVLRKPELLCITLNPTYPERRIEGFRLSMIDFSSLKSFLSKKLGVPCIDVLREEDELCELLNARVRRGWAFTT